MGILDGLMSGAFLGPAISGVLGFLGQDETNEENRQINTDNSAFNAEQAALNRSFNADQAQLQRNWSGDQAEALRNWQTNMANSAWQRSTSDMQAAGINPMLAFMKGGADTPSGAMPQAGSASGQAASAASPIAMQNKSLAGMQATQAAMNSAAQAATIDRTNAETERTRAETARTRQQTTIDSYKEANYKEWGAYELDKLKEEVRNLLARTALSQGQNEYIQTQATNLAAQTGLTEAQTKRITYEIAKIVSATKLDNQQISRVFEETKNAIRYGKQIDARTGNITADTRLKELDIDGFAGAESRYYQTPMGEMSIGLKDAASLINSAGQARNAFRNRQKSQVTNTWRNRDGSTSTVRSGEW